MLPKEFTVEIDLEPLSFPVRSHDDFVVPFVVRVVFPAHLRYLSARSLFLDRLPNHRRRLSCWTTSLPIGSLAQGCEARTNPAHRPPS